MIEVEKKCIQVCYNCRFTCYNSRFSAPSSTGGGLTLLGWIAISGTSELIKTNMKKFIQSHIALKMKLLLILA